MKTSPASRSGVAAHSRSAGWIAPLLAALLPLALPAQPPDRAFGLHPTEVLGTNAPLPSYRALLIGINEYRHWGRLRYPVRDAEKLEPILRRDYGFTEIRTLYDTDATQTNIVAELEELAEDLGPNDALLIYFAGHGHYAKSTDKGYWIPSEGPPASAGPKARAQWVDNVRVIDLIRRMKARQVLLISDSCFSGSLFRELRSEDYPLGTRQVHIYQQGINKPSRFGITSGTLEPVPDYSHFAIKLQEQLQFPGRSVFGALDLAYAIRAAVKDWNVQTSPICGRFPGENDDPAGEFIFVRRTGLPEVPVAPFPTPTPSRPNPLLTASKYRPCVNSLGMKFVPVEGTDVLFCIWETRVQDFEAFVNDRTGNGGFDYRQGMQPFVLKSDDWKQRGWGFGWNGPGFAQAEDHPVTCVSWEDAQAFCRWLTRKERREGKLNAEQSYRLPQDWEWSVAVGLNESRFGWPEDKDEKIADVYPWGTQWPPPDGAGNYAGAEAANRDWPSDFGVIAGYRDPFPRTSPVGRFDANRHGLYDLGGNVWE